jgi:3-dehydroquinate synthetase
MERAAWTEERLDDLAEAMRSGFARLDQDNRDLRSEIREGFAELRGEINDLRVEFRTVMFRVGGGVIVGLIGVIAAILARGV